MGDDLTIYDRVAAAVAARREPDLHSFLPADVDAAMRRALTFPGPRASFQHWLTGRVEVLSEGTVALEPLDNGAPAQQQGDLLFRVTTGGEPFGEPVSISASETPVRWPMRGGG